LYIAKLYEISAIGMPHNAAKISHIRVAVLTKTMRDEFNSVTYTCRAQYGYRRI